MYMGCHSMYSEHHQLLQLTLNPAPEVAVPAVPAAGGPKSGLVASYGGDSDDSGDEDDGAVIDESKLVDWSKLACLLCKRQFQSREILAKHTQFSDLHKVCRPSEYATGSFLVRNSHEGWDVGILYAGFIQFSVSLPFSFDNF